MLKRQLVSGLTACTRAEASALMSLLGDRESALLSAARVGSGVTLSDFCCSLLESLLVRWMAADWSLNL